MTTYDNQPPLPDWRPEPRAPVFDLVTRVKALVSTVPIVAQTLDGIGDN